MPVAKAARRQRQDDWLSPGVVSFCSGVVFRSKVIHSPGCPQLSR